MITFASNLIKFHKVHLRFLLFLVTKIIITNSSTRCTSSNGREMLKWNSNYNLSWIWIKDWSQSRTSASKLLVRTVFSRFFKELLLDCYWESILFWNIFGELSALCSHVQKKNLFRMTNFIFLIAWITELLFCSRLSTRPFMCRFN